MSRDSTKSAPLDPASPCPLHAGIRAHVVARKCRDALLAFVDPSAADWDKGQLTTWLAGHAAITNLAREVERTERQTSDVVPSLLCVQLESENGDEVARNAREAVLARLERAVSDGDISFAREAIALGTVRPCRDSWGYDGWMPVDGARVPLVQRVLSLAAVDYLVRPADYLALLAKCDRCDAITFDAAARYRGTCDVHAPKLRSVPWD